MAAAKTSEDPIVWQKAHAAVLKVYAMTAKFPREEMFGLSSQLRRAMAGVPANIAEGFGRKGAGDKTRFYNIASASLDESRYFLILARDLKYADTNALPGDLDEVGRMLDSYSKAVSTSKLGSVFRVLLLSFCLLPAAYFFKG